MHLGFCTAGRARFLTTGIAARVVRALLDAPFKQTQLLAETTKGVRAINYLATST